MSDLFPLLSGQVGTNHYSSLKSSKYGCFPYAGDSINEGNSSRGSLEEAFSRYEKTYTGNDEAIRKGIDIGSWVTTDI